MDVDPTNIKLWLSYSEMVRTCHLKLVSCIDDQSFTGAQSAKHLPCSQLV
jgi:hypothetical protein